MRFLVVAATLFVAVLLAAPSRAQSTVCAEAGGSITCEERTDRPGSDFYSFDMPVADANLCRAYCGQHGRCTSYTYVNPGMQGASARCWLKEGTAPAPTPNDCCVSGVRAQGAAPFSLNQPAVAPSIGADGRPQIENARRLTGLRPLVFLAGYYDDPTGQSLPRGAIPPAPVASPPRTPDRLVPQPIGAIGALRPMNPADGTPGQLRQFIFGPGSQTMPDYFYENSNGRFTFFNAGVIGPTTLIRQPRSAEDEAGLGVAAIAASGMDFGPFDLNDDGTIGPSELTLVFLGNLTSTTAAYRTNYPVDVPVQSVGGPTRLGTAPCATTTTQRPNGVRRELRLCPGVVAAGFDSSFDNVAHELGHAAGADDVYGDWLSGECWSTGFTLMGCTGGRVFGQIRHPRTLHLDPWHKLQFGWSTARYVPIDAITAGSPLTLNVIAPQSGDERPLVLYDRANRRNEFFIVEWRGAKGARGGPGVASIASGADPIAVGGYDRYFVNDAAGEESGLVFWHVAHQPGQPQATRIYLGHLELNALPVASVPNRGDDLAHDLDLNGAIDGFSPGTDQILQSSQNLPVVAMGQTAPRARSYPLMHQSPRPGAQMSQGCAPYGKGTKTPLYWFDGTPVGVSFDVPIVSADGSRATVVIEPGEGRRRVNGGVVEPMPDQALMGASCGRFSAALNQGECESRCLADSNCAGYTYFSPGSPASQQGAAGACIMARSITGAQTNVLARSGIVRSVRDLVGRALSDAVVPDN